VGIGNTLGSGETGRKCMFISPGVATRGLTGVRLCIIAVARAAQGVELMNRDPDVLANRERAHDFLRDALDDIDECLQDSKFITSSSLRGPGITLRFNLTHILQTLVDM